jgi:hypothetical protein
MPNHHVLVGDVDLNHGSRGMADNRSGSPETVSFLMKLLDISVII